MECHVRYRVIGRDAYEVFSHGKTVNMSGNGILLVTDGVLVPGLLLEVKIDWPARLDERIRLKLLVKGFVNLGSQLTDSSHEERPIPLPRTPFPAGNHRLRRMGLPSLLSELP